MRNIRPLAIAALGLVIAPQAANAQATVKIDINSKNVAPSVILSDGTQVLLMESINSTNAQPKYRYLPLTPRLVKKPDGTPVFLYASYNKSKRNNDTGMDQVGGLLNFSMTYGLDDPKQLAELAQIIRNTDIKKGAIFKPNALLDGPIFVKPESEKDSFFITSATLNSDSPDLTRKIITTGKAPLFPGSQVACAARLTGDGAQIFESTLKAKGAADLAVSFNLAFDALMPAVDAKITIDWSRLHANSDTYASEFKDRLTSVDANASGNYLGLFKGSANVNVNNRKVSKEEVKAFYDFLQEKSIIKFESKQLVSDVAAQKIIDGFFTTFLEMITKKDSPPDPSSGRSSLTPPDMSHLEKLQKDTAKAKDDSGFFGGVNVAVKVDNTEYRVRQYSINNVNHSIKQVISLNQSKAYSYPVQITGNIAQFYNQAKDNKNCVLRFYLDDPFFQKFDVLAPINIDSPESFSSFANYVTVTIRKKRGAGLPDFTDSKTFTRNDMKDGLPVAKFTYAGGDTAEISREFEYSSQWGLRNGKVWPDKPTFTKATLEGININPPLIGKLVETIGFSDGMVTKGVIRAVAQVHYLQLSDEKELNVSLSVGQANDGVKNTIYVDQDIASYVYRVVFYTNNGKKYATDWQRGDATGTVNATVPDDILDNAAYLSRAEQMKANEAVKPLIIEASGVGGK